MNLPSYAESLGTLLPLIKPLPGHETIALPAALGRTLHATISADRDLPPFNRAMMDGYAVRAADVTRGCQLKVIGEIAAGMSADGVQITTGCCAKIATGAPLPDSADAVVQHEWTDRSNPVMMQCDGVQPGHAVHARGSDARAGDTVLAAGTCLQAHHLGIAAAVGACELRCVPQPSAMLLTSGDEVRAPDASVELHQIRNSNAIMLQALLQRMGVGRCDHQHLPDEQQPTIDAAARALQEYDIVITVGGISAGARDRFHDAYETLHLRRILSGAAIQPGKPITLAKSERGGWIVSLPGNPVSALACACLFIWPMLQRMASRSGALPWRMVMLAEAVRPNARRQAFRPAILQPDGRSALVPSWAGSGDLVHTAATHGLIDLPVQDDIVAAGTERPFLPWPAVHPTLA